MQLLKDERAATDSFAVIPWRRGQRRARKSIGPQYGEDRNGFRSLSAARAPEHERRPQRYRPVPYSCRYYLHTAHTRSFSVAMLSSMVATTTPVLPNTRVLLQQLLGAAAAGERDNLALDFLLFVDRRAGPLISLIS